MPEPTTYIVLRRTNTEGAAWLVENANVPAANSNSAIRKVVDGAGENLTGTYVAVPARSWKPVTVRAETSVTLKLEDATE